MQIEIISFGKVSEFIENQYLELQDIRNIEELKHHLETTFPLLATIKYKLALNKQMVQGNPDLSNSDQIAIMPPFSGG